MASVFNRGTRTAPKFYVRIKVSGKGGTGRPERWISKRCHALTLGEARRIASAMQAREERVSLGLEAPAYVSLSARSLLESWAAALTNRGARNDRYRIAKHLVPRFGGLRIAEVTSAAVVLWLDELAASTMKSGSQRGLLALLSRFFSWCCDRGYLPANPAKAIPASRRPRGSQGGGPDTPWITSDATVLHVFRALPEPIRYVFLLANRCGLRTGEAAGLRLSDLADLHDGAIRVRFNYLSPLLKEAKAGAPKVKYAPAPADLPELLGPWLDSRRAAGAGPEDLAFPARDGRFPAGKDEVGAAFRKVREELGLPRALTFHRAGRHSFASRLLSAGAALDEVSQALGHADVRLTQRTYNHFVRQRFSAALVAPMQLGAKVIPLRAAAAPAAETEAAHG
ncbi:MAG TPA: tyrosine-type recombinase/integrase [Polyangia bacterium]|nr:tyrosine-type recombinase/integrase [Polyangia bacterium]